MSRSHYQDDSIKLRVVDEPPPRSGVTARQLLQDYLDKAISKQKYQYRLSKVMEYSLNALIILQVIVTALVTVVTSLETTPRTRIASQVLAASATITAALIARAKGTNQPERAQNHAKDLDSFIGRCNIFLMESGSETGEEVKAEVMKLVELYEAIEDKAIQAGRGRETQATDFEAEVGSQPRAQQPGNRTTGSAEPVSKSSSLNMAAYRQPQPPPPSAATSRRDPLVVIVRQDRTANHRSAIARRGEATTGNHHVSRGGRR